MPQQVQVALQGGGQGVLKLLLPQRQPHSTQDMNGHAGQHS
jgi:hypothetical protein